MRRLLFAAIIGISSAFPQLVCAASITTETFSAGASGWQGTSFLEGTWSFTGGAARLRFPNSGLIPIPSKGTLSNLTTATSGSITGNYAAAGINFIGFRFNASTELPSAVNLLIGGQSNTFFRSYEVTESNTWYSFTASLSSLAAGGWQTLEGSVSNFAATMQDVRFIAIQVARSGVTNQQYVIDDIFLGRQPTALAPLVTSGQHLASWDFLQSNVTYRVESTTNLILQEWSEVETIIATGMTYQAAYPSSDVPVFYRIVKP